MMLNFMDEHNRKLYAVLGISAPICGVMQRQLPVMLETVLLPYGDKIIYDSYLGPYDISYGRSLIETIENDYNNLVEKYGIAESLTNV